MYWTIAQQVAHHTVNGCNLRAGDLLGSGTISGPDVGSLGSLVEMSYGGKSTVKVGEAERTYLEDGDEVTIEGFCSRPDLDYIVGFGTCTGHIMPAKS